MYFREGFIIFFLFFFFERGAFSFGEECSWGGVLLFCFFFWGFFFFGYNFFF